MFVFYLVAFIFFAVGVVAYLASSKIAWWEWLLVGASGFIVAGIFQACITASMTADVETWSGQISQLKHIPTWVEYYEYEVYHYESRQTGTDSKGRATYTSVKVHDAWVPTSRVHTDEWSKADTLGQGWGIAGAEYADLLKKFGGGEQKQPGIRFTFEHNSHLLSGDPNDYYGVNSTAWVQPTTCIKSWTNRVRAAQSVFCFQSVPKDAHVYAYPPNKDPFASDRLFGAAAGVGTFPWDQMNARLGPVKKVNVVLCAYPPTEDRSIADLQRAAWCGGKKNDIVICVGATAGQKPTWTRVFGWSDSNTCKYDLEQIMLTHPLTKDVVPLIEQEVRAHYTIKDWTQFDYLTVEPPVWTYFLFLAVLLVVEGGLWVWSFTNGIGKDGVEDGEETDGVRLRQGPHGSYYGW